MCEYLSHMNFLSKLTFSLHISYTVIFFIFNFTLHKNKKNLNPLNCIIFVQAMIDIATLHYFWLTYIAEHMGELYFILS